MAKRLSTNEFINGLRQGDRAVLSKAITLAESDLPDDMQASRELLEKIMPATGNSVRVAITGVPGAGKSTFIEAFGKTLTSQGKKVAVLAVDPTSSRSKGSIMGDKTRMEELSRDPNAFIRPSPSGKSLGGITRRTREAILLCEAAGYDTILIETVGVGQVETTVHGMVDFFMLVVLTGAGDELQVMKKGVIELADLIVINKADGLNKDKARLVQAEMERVLEIFPTPDSGWRTPVVRVSSTERDGIAEVEVQINTYLQRTRSNDYFFRQRKEQNVRWMKEAIQEMLQEEFDTVVRQQRQQEEIEKEVAEGKMPPLNGALQLFKFFKASRNKLS